MKFRTFTCVSDAPASINTAFFHILSAGWLLVFALFCCQPAAVFGQESANGAACVNACPSPLSAIKFYVVIDGRLETRTLAPQELPGAVFATDGYVSGIVAVGRKGIAASVDGRPMPAARPKADGTFSFGYYGKLEPEQLLRPGAGKETDGIENPEPPRKPLFGDVYSCFPSVPADTISKNARFFLEFATEDGIWRVQVRHSGQREIAKSATPRTGAASSIPFRYVGARHDRISAAGGNLRRRMEAVSQGIRNVESAFHMDLIDTVNILDFEEIHNAVTCLDRNDIWFYINTFEQEPLSELHVIAEHEALHILVDRLGLTGNRTIRKLFADLKGYDDFSIERFWIVTQGQAGSRTRLQKGEKGYFFDFISERNYLNGMKGGHPQEDLDEFCTSFLHTLLYMDRFEANLQKADALGSRKSEFIIAGYAKLLEAVGQELNRTEPVTGGMGDSILRAEFVSERLSLLQGLDRQLQALTDRAASGK